ncbi:type I toxin-antitoxin system toxin [Clostridioides difficile]
MDNFLLSILASIMASYIVYLMSKLFRKRKNHSKLALRVVGNLTLKSNSISLNNF